jgi:hypothetical protein
MQKFDYHLNLFSGYAKDVKTPEELYEAIDKLGPLPRYWSICANNKQEDDISDFESAKKEAQAVYEFAMRIAESLRKSKKIKTPLPPPTDDPFLGISTIKEWCTDVSQKQPANSGKAGDPKNQQPAESGRNATPAKYWGIGDWFWKLYEKTLKVIVDAVFERWWPK